MIHRKLVIAALFGCAAIPALALRFKNGAVGQPAPAFTLTDSTGKAHSLSDFKGKYVVLEWFNKDCPFVKKHYESGNMQKVQGWAKEKGEFG